MEFAWTELTAATLLWGSDVSAESWCSYHWQSPQDHSMTIVAPCVEMGCVLAAPTLVRAFEWSWSWLILSWLRQLLISASLLQASSFLPPLQQLSFSLLLLEVSFPLLASFSSQLCSLEPCSDCLVAEGG